MIEVRFSSLLTIQLGVWILGEARIVLAKNGNYVALVLTIASNDNMTRLIRLCTSGVNISVRVVLEDILGKMRRPFRYAITLVYQILFLGIKDITSHNFNHSFSSSS